MKIVFLLLFAFQLTVVAQEKGTPCPFPKYKKGQTSIQVNEDTRIYIECKNKQKEKANREREERNRLRQIEHEKRQEQKRREEQERKEERQRQNDEEVQGK